MQPMGPEGVDERQSGGRLLLGTARAVITPPVGSELSGFAARTAPMRGVHDDLYARALAWSSGGASSPASTVVLLTLDVIGLDRHVVGMIRGRITARTGIADENIAVTTTHTHGGPPVMEGRLGGHVDGTYLGFLIDTAAGAALAAVDAVGPVTARYTLGHESQVGKNRRIAGGPMDPDVPVLRFDAPDGSVRALLVSYACHPVTLGTDNLLATADYPGYVVRTLESLYPGAHVQFVTGCCGQINTGHVAQDSVSGRGMGRRTYEECARLGRAIAGAALQASEHGAPPGGEALATAFEEHGNGKVSARRRVVELPLQSAPAPEELRTQAEIWRAEAERLERSDAPAGDVLLRHAWARWAEATAEDPHPAHSVAAEVMVLALGGIRLVLLPGEAFVEFGHEIKRRAGRKALMVAAYANGNPGYIPHRSAYAQGGYEVTEAYRFYGYPAGFAPEAGELLVEEALRLVAELDAARRGRRPEYGRGGGSPMATESIGFAIVGAGMIARYYAEALARIEGVCLVAVHHPNSGRAQEIGERFGVPCEASYDALLTRRDVDVVCMCTPSGLHAAQGIAAARAGKHVLVEKPMALTLADADSLIAACKAGGVQLGVALQRRTDPRLRAVRAALEAGGLGRPVLANVSMPYRRTQEYYDSAGWRGTWALDGGGALMNQGIHLVDLLLWYMGDASTVQAQMATLIHDIEVEDTLTTTVRFTSGALGTIAATTGAGRGFPHRVELFGERGCIQVEGDEIMRWECEVPLPSTVACGETPLAGAGASPTGIDVAGHVRLIDDFAAAVREGRPPLIPGEEGRRSLALVLAAYESARLGRAVVPR